MSTIRITRTTSQILLDDSATKNDTTLVKLLSKDLTYRKNDYIFSTKYKAHVWDGYFHLLSKKGQFRTGLLWRILPALIKGSFTVQDDRNLPAPAIDETSPSWGILRDYQKEAVKAVFNNYVGGYWIPRGILHLPPRSGKTLIASELISQLKSYPAVFVVERVDLAWQTASALSKHLNTKIGVVGDGSSDIQDITVITIQSLHNAFDIKVDEEVLDKSVQIEKALAKKAEVVKMLESAQVVIIDKSHHVTASGYQTAVIRAKNAYAVIGLSGTPWVDDGSDLLLENAIGPVIFKKTYSYMIDRGYLLPLDIYFYHLPKVLCYSASYASIYKMAVTDNIIKHYVIQKIANRFIAQGKSVAILTVQIKHAKELVKQIPGAVLLTGAEKGTYRHDMFQKLDRKEIKAIVSTIFNEGIDVPHLEVVINAEGGRDSRRIFQRLRIMTPADGKTRGIYIDFYHYEKHLESHSKRRLAFYKGEKGFTVIERDVRDEMKKMFGRQVPLA